MEHSTKKRNRSSPIPPSSNNTSSQYNPSAPLLFEYSIPTLPRNSLKEWDALVDKGWVYYKQDQYADALTCFKKAAAARAPRGWYALAVMYTNGKGVIKDKTKAELFYALIIDAASKKDMQAQFALGLMHHNGYGVTQSYIEAYQYYTLAEKQGYPPAQNNLGCLYLLGHGITQNYKKAYSCFLLSAVQEYPNAQNNLGILYRDGLCVPQDYQLASYWFGQAAKQGFSDAQRNLNAIQPYILQAQFADVLNSASFFHKQPKTDLSHSAKSHQNTYIH